MLNDASVCRLNGYFKFLVTLPSQRQRYGSTMEMDCYNYNH